MDILSWERKLKDVLRNWIADAESPFAQLIQEVEQSFRSEQRESLQATHPDSANGMEIGSAGSHEEDLLTWTLSLLCRLHERDALPAILFNYDRHECERVCRAVMEQLQTAESQQVKSGAAWSRKLEKWENWKKLQEKTASKASKKTAKRGSEKEDEKVSKLDLQRDAADTNVNPWESFDPEEPIDGKILLSIIPMPTVWGDQHNLRQLAYTVLQRRR